MAEKKECEKSQNIVDEASEKEKKESLNQEPEVSEETGSEEGGEEGEADEAARLSAELETLKATIEKMQKDYLLLMAEFDNFRKRTLREKSELIKNGGENCMKAILPVIDDFERGLAAVEESNDLAAVKEGMSLIYNKFKSYLEQNGVKEIPTEGADFDTEYHEAVTMFPASDPAQKGKVIDTVQKGYTLNDKVIRFAKVVVGGINYRTGSNGKKRDYYEVLGVAKNATAEEIKKAYRKKAINITRIRTPETKRLRKKFKEAAEAYEVLSDADKRARYDQFGHQGVRVVLPVAVSVAAVCLWRIFSRISAIFSVVDSADSKASGAAHEGDVVMSIKVRIYE